MRTTHPCSHMHHSMIIITSRHHSIVTITSRYCRDTQYELRKRTEENVKKSQRNKVSFGLMPSHH